MFNLECVKCGTKGLIREVNINTDSCGNALDCMTQIISDFKQFNLSKKACGFSVTCNKCGNTIMEYDKPY